MKIYSIFVNHMYYKTNENVNGFSLKRVSSKEESEDVSLLLSMARNQVK